MDFDFISLDGLGTANPPVLPSPELVNYYKCLDDRVIWIDDEIGPLTLEITKNILRWNADDADKGLAPENRKPIKLLIFSPGGDLDACNNLIDIIELSKTPVWGINVGMAMSAAFHILLSCHKKMCTKNSTALIHKGAAAMQGNAGDLINGVENYKAQLKRLKDFILSKTNISPQLYAKKAKEDWYVSAEEQVKYGIVEKIVSDIDELI